MASDGSGKKANIKNWKKKQGSKPKSSAADKEKARREKFKSTQGPGDLF